MRKKLSVKISVLTGILISLLCALAACGKDAGKSRQIGVDGYIYQICGEVALPSDTYFRCEFENGCLYYVEGSALKRVPLDEALLSGEKVLTGDTEEEWILEKETKTLYSGQYISDFAVDGNGNCYIFECTYQSNSQYQSSIVGKKLVGVGKDGSRLYEANFGDMKGDLYEGMLGVSVQADKKGNAYVLLGGVIYVVDSQGKVTDQIPTDEYGREGDTGSSYQEALLRCGDERIYYAAEGIRGMNSWEVWEVVLNNGYSFRKLEEFSGEYGGELSDGLDAPAVIGTNGYVYEYDPEADSPDLVMRMEDSGLASSAKGIFRLNEEYLLLALRKRASSENYFCLLKKTSVDDLPQKEVVVLASLFPDRTLELRTAVADFNRLSTKYHVVIESYGYVRGDPEREEAAQMRLDSALVSRDPPDLLDLAELDIYKYAGKNVLQDLVPYLEQSEKMDIGDYSENIIEAYTINGGLVCVPSYFNIDLFWGRAAQVEGELGWTLEEMMDLAERYPEDRLFDSAEFHGSDWVWREVLGDYCIERFVDQESGICDFQNEEFGEIIQWVGSHHGEGGMEFYIYEADDLLLKQAADFSCLARYLDFVVLYGDEFVLKGYPTSDGKARCKADPRGTIGIVSKSDRKEGAWEFLEYFMGLNDIEIDPESEQIYTGVDFNSRKEVMEKLLEYAREEEPKDFIWDRGEKIPVGKFSIYDYRKQTSCYFNGLNEEQEEYLRKILASVDFRPRSNAEETIIDIIVEETETFYNGDKDIQEVMQIIQNRAKQVLQE